jgi:peptidoglycan/LPS O-acetylase OafA/YrhL
MAVFVVAAFTLRQSTTWLYYGGYTVMALASIAIILSVLDRGTWLYRILSSRVLIWIGVRSYALYLWHTFVFAAVQRHWPHQHKYFLISVAFIGSFIVAALSYQLVERPFQGLRRRHRVIADHEGAATSG